MSAIKLNWGGGIVVLYLGFVALIVFLVAGSMRESVDLVSADYYQKELKYQDIIEAGKNQATLSQPVAIKTTATEVAIQFPEEFASSRVTGTVQFYSPVNPAWDVTEDIITTGNVYTIPRTKLRSTTYKVKMNWDMNGKKYYQESDLTLH
jgi:hypothetical protein